MANEISTMYSYLMVKAASASNYTKLVDIYEDPDLGGEPERIQVTTLTDPQHRYINGVKDVDTFTYQAYYTLTDYQTVKAYEDDEVHDFAEWYGADSSGVPDGHNGKFKFTGMLSVFPTGGGVNDPRSMTISISVNSEVELDS